MLQVEHDGQQQEFLYVHEEGRKRTNSLLFVQLARVCWDAMAKRTVCMRERTAHVQTGVLDGHRNVTSNSSMSLLVLFVPHWIKLSISKSSTTTMSYSGPPYEYHHSQHIAGPADILKHVAFIQVIKSLQPLHPEGLLVVDGFCGDGVYDLNQHSNPISYQKGIVRLIQTHEQNPESTPSAVVDFIDTVLTVTGCKSSQDLDVYPGSPILAQHLLRNNVDELRLIDRHVEEVQWLKEQHVDSFRSANIYDPSMMEFILPYTDGGRHPVILLDPDYEDVPSDRNDYLQIPKLITEILDQHPYATVLVVFPLLQNHKFRWSYTNSLKEVAKKYAKSGRYFCNTVISKDGFQGSAVLVCNPTRDFDDVLNDETIHWLANTLNSGKDEYTVEQVNKKPKK
jgi:23S rRNA A2030 N6-methylase RlmJ